MKVLVNDFGGYAFPAQLSRALANRGHTVAHAYCGSHETTPAGCAHQASDQANLSFEPIKLDQPLQKYSFVKRWQQECEYGAKLAQFMRRFQPECVLSANTPLDAQRTIWKHAANMRVARTFWLQDVIGIATRKILAKKLSLPGQIIGKYYERLERRLVKQSEQVVVIADAFKSLLEQWRVDASRTSVIENWAPLDELPSMPRDNPWSQARKLANKIVFLYSGTLSMKHDPSLLLELAKAIEQHNGVLIVRSQGLGADWLKERLKESPVASLRIEPYGAYSELAQALAAADVLIAILEPGAAVYSVPSKVLTYMCAQRAILLAVPPENLAAQIVQREEAGLVSAPDLASDFVANAIKLINQPELRKRMADNALGYASRSFSIDHITNRFEEILCRSLKINA